jgi:hypothetical protein
MLLSADWFAPYWRNFGLVLSETECALVRKVARRVVKSFMDGTDTYWNANFSDERVTRTASSFAESLGQTDISSAGRLQISSLLTSASRGSEEATTLWLFGALTDQLVSGTSSTAPPSVAGSTLPVVRSLWAARSSSDNAPERLEQAALASETEWDRYLRSLTPDLPTFLPDWAGTALQQPDDFRRFWAQLFWVASREDRQSLRAWFETEAKKVADPGFVVKTPAWMRTD